MKTPTLLILVFLIIFSSCNKDPKQKYLSLSGNIENPNSDTIRILDSNQKLVKTIILNNDTFSDTLNITEGYYKLDDGKDVTTMFLKPEFNLTISLNTDAFDETISYEGLGANENNYLAKKALLEESLAKFTHSTSFVDYNEAQFLKTQDSIFKLRMNLFKSYKKLDETFEFLESNSIEINKLYSLSSFESSKRYFSNEKDFKVSSNFPNPYEKINFSDDRLLKIYFYLPFVQKYISDQTRKNLKESQDFFVEYINTIDKEVKNEKIKEKLLYHFGKYDLSFVNELDSIYNKVIALVTNEEYLKEITLNYQNLKKIEKGATSPNFKFLDINNKMVTLIDLKGKLVYIDIWATWCAPCLKEIPPLKKLEEKYHGKNIQFVSICKNDTKERWKKMVNEKQLKGIQLFASDNNDSFFEDYSVQGIPWFILIDENGKIIDANAKRPSNPKLEEEIELYLFE